jgi:hypothetical protein
MQKNKARLLSPGTQSNWKWIKDLNERTETIKLLEENIGEMLHDIGMKKDLLEKTSHKQETKANIDKWDYIKLESFYTAKKIIYRVHRQPME